MDNALMFGALRGDSEQRRCYGRNGPRARLSGETPLSVGGYWLLQPTGRSSASPSMERGKGGPGQAESSQVSRITKSGTQDIACLVPEQVPRSTVLIISRARNSCNKKHRRLSNQKSAALLSVTRARRPGVSPDNTAMMAIYRRIVRVVSSIAAA